MTWDTSEHREFQEAKRSIDMRDLVSRTHRIVDGKVSCVVHAERTPSMHVFADHAFCYGCGTYLDPVGWVERVHNLSFREAKSEILAIAGHSERAYPRPVAAVPRRVRPKPLGADRQKDLEHQQLDRLPATLAGRGITLADAQLLHALRDGEDTILPIYDVTGQIVQLKRRIYQGKNKYKYDIKGNGAQPWISPLIQHHRVVVLREGELNAAVLWLKRPDVGVIGMAGASQKPPLHLVSRKSVYIWTDDDDAGHKAAQRWVQAIAPVAGEVFLMPYHAQDPCEIAARSVKELQLWVTMALKSAEL